MRLRAIVSLLLVTLAGTASAVERPPNFIIILTDDLGYGDAGVYGHPSIRTPRIDRMAAEGVRLTEFYSPAPTCTPARAALLTGRYPLRSGMTRVLIPLEKWGLPQSEITLAEALKARGYTTGIVGKWHLGGRKPYRPAQHGFDMFYGVLHSNDMARMPLISYPAFSLYDGEKVVESPARQRLLTRNYTERAVRFIRENAERPFFLYLSHTMPHRPLARSDKFRGVSAHGIYGDVVEELDWSTGEVLDAVREANIDENTLVIFTSDNGPWVLGASQKAIRGGSAGPLRGGKGTTWEGGMRVPMIARWPSRLPGGETREGIASLMDLFTTLVALAGGEVPGDRVIDGKNIVGFLDGGEPSPHNTMYYFHQGALYAVRSGDWKVHIYQRPMTTRGRVTRPVALDPPELFNLAHNLGETTNLFSEQEEMAARLIAMGKRFESSIQPVMALPSPTRSLFQGLTTGAPRNPDRVPQGRNQR